MARSSRSIPQQIRAQRTIEEILAASAQLLDRDGYQGLSTNRIAEEAHLSIGTVYRYFADKDAIVLALRGHAEEDIMRRLVAALAEALSMEVTAGARHVLAVLVDALEEHRGVMGAVINDLPMGSQSNVLPGIEEHLHHLARLTLLQHYPQLDSADADEIIYLGMGTVLQLALRIAIDRPPGMSKESLLDRAAALLVGANQILAAQTAAEET
ncbi:TetR/AcrR family transcriptional regulator [Mycobacterium sp. 1274756.6]|uniref:TetR/AcrR family transcriptional regulator n=1 Tax=Mycobacterium sp. 1274756.6 TaxID=1834076 RepID=UPI0009ECEE3D|nr:TetR/AcrR family transcriptional regulator [Mycobacterium sp. 1274756.6]